jgi:hypothetical protein
LAWEKKNFDSDGDGLYDAYAAIWASDALQYSGGGVTHSSAYNYRANKDAAKLALLVGEDGTAYEKEANKILDAINKNLWMPDKGWYAEYKDLLGNKLIHPSAGLWTVYHAIDEGIANPFQAYQTLRYVDNNIPHIPVKAKGLGDTTLYTLSTTNWQPYTWSLNNVALAELLHTSLAYWQGGRSEEAYKLWKSSLIESMYLGSSPGNIQQLSFYDAIRGELYRDFADPIAMTARSLVEGLFGIKPDALNNKLVIQPGFPASWNNASIKTADINFDFKRSGDKETYTIETSFYKNLSLKLLLSAYKDNISSVLINGKQIKWKILQDAVNKPSIEITVPPSEEYRITINWAGKELGQPSYRKYFDNDEKIKISSNILTLAKLFDPEKVLTKVRLSRNELSADFFAKKGVKTFFIKIKQGIFNWWQPIDIHVRPYSGVGDSPINWDYSNEKINLNNYFNDEVINIFKNKYTSPRPTSPTLQLPVQGIGNWAYHSITANINDSGLRNKAGQMNEIKTSSNIPFRVSSAASEKNIVFTSMWDNYPDSVVIPLQGKAWHAHLLMAGSTNPMQSRLVNGEMIFNYKDGTADTLELKNPENWWPVEQDYYVDGFAFTTDAPRPIRISLKSGEEIPANYKYTSIKGFSNFAIDGGAATVLNLQLNETKELKNLVLRTIANDVVIGLMALTLER